MAGGMHSPTSTNQPRGLAERLDLDPPLIAGSDRPVRKPHVWVHLNPHRGLPWPGVLVRQAIRADTHQWTLKVVWVEADPQHADAPMTRTRWLSPEQVQPA